MRHNKNELNKWGHCNKENFMECFWIHFLFVHFIEWASIPAAGGHLFWHLLHLTLLGAVVIFWLNDAWKWISIFCDQKRYVMAVRYMHYKQPGCLGKWEYHTGLCTSETGIHSFRLLFYSINSTLQTPMPFFTDKPEEMDYVATPDLTLKTHTYN